MKLIVLPDSQFTCSACGDCCHNWHVELTPDEVERVSKLPWPAADPLHKIDKTFTYAGRTYLAHAEDRGCVFLNRETKLCRIHAQFGVDAKPIGCRLYPFQIKPTFQGVATVTGRYGCPTIRQNVGAPYTDSLPELKNLAKRVALPENFSNANCCNLDQDQVNAVCEFAAMMIHGFERNDQRAIFLIVLADWLGTLNNDQLDREVLGSAFIELKSAVETTTAAAVKKPGLLARASFRMYLGLHLRRDEDVLDHRASRLARVLAMLRTVLGVGDFHSLGVNHPHGRLGNAHLFDSSISSGETAAFELHWRMTAAKILSLQFFGTTNGDRDLLAGLRSLALLYPLVVAAAKYRAGNRGGSKVESEDVDYGVSVIEHAFGRSPVLNQSFARSIEKLLLDPAIFVRMVRTV